MVAMREAKRTRGKDERTRNGRGSGDDHGGGGGIVSDALQYVKDGARAATETLQRTLGETTGSVLDTVLDEAESVYQRQRKSAISRVSSLSKIAARSAHALHAVKADAVADYVEQAARQVERSTDYLRDRDLAEILEDAGDVIRRNPGAAMGGMFILGFAATRFFKASASRGEQGEDGGEEDERPQRRAMKKRRQQR